MVSRRFFMRSHRSWIFQYGTDLKAICLFVISLRVITITAYTNTYATDSSERTWIVRKICDVASTIMNVRGHAAQIGALIRQACEEGARPQGIGPTETLTW